MPSGLLTALQSRSLPNARTLTTRALLGADSLVIPAGTSARLPPAPRAFPFAGYNTLSLFLEIAGLDVGDSLSVQLDTLDPDSAAGGALADGWGNQEIATLSANGAAGRTVFLPDLLGSIPAQTKLPTAAVNVVAWGLIPGGSDASDNLQSDDGDATCIQGPDLTPSVGAEWAMDTPINPGTSVGWRAVLVARATTLGGGMDADFFGFASRAWNGVIFTGGNAIVSGGGSFLDYSAMGTDYLEYVYNFTEAQADLIRTTGAGLITLGLVSRDSGGTAVDHVIRVTQARLEVPAGMATITNSAIPFYRNLFVLDAFGSANDVTVSRMFAVLSNRTRVPVRARS